MAAAHHPEAHTMFTPQLLDTLVLLLVVVPSLMILSSSIRRHTDHHEGRGREVG
jgi:hypothetical protein